MENGNSKVACTVPGCKKALPPEHMWLPEWKALVRANGGRVAVADFSKFALCGHHGHLLRESGVRVYRYLDSVEREKAREERHRTEELAFRPFAEKFAPKANGSAKAKGPRPGADGRFVGQGLSRCAKADAKKRQSGRLAEAPKAAEGTSVPEASKPDGAAEPSPAS